MQTLAADVAAYDPSLSMWADGAEKRRFIRLPPGTSIDSSDVRAERAGAAAPFTCS